MSMKNLLLLAFVMFTISCTAQRGRFTNLVENRGKIGIGTKTPDELLTVKGKIHTQEVIVDLNGAVAPDYVFDQYINRSEPLNPDYRFHSLQELERFIQNNGHLPGVPSASDIEKNGLALKEMNLILLEKVEELTIYTLQQQKEIEALKEEIKAIKEKQ